VVYPTDVKEPARVALPAAGKRQNRLRGQVQYRGKNVEATGQGPFRSRLQGSSAADFQKLPQVDNGLWIVGPLL